MDKGMVVFIIGLLFGFLSLAADDSDLCGLSCCLLFIGPLMMNSARQNTALVAMPMVQQHAVHIAPQMAMQPQHQTVPAVSSTMSQMGAPTFVATPSVSQPTPPPPAPVVHSGTVALPSESLTDTISAARREELYEAHLVSALVDGAISEKEDRHLADMRIKYGISDEQSDTIVRRLGHDPSTLAILKKALAIEESGRYADAAALYEAAGHHERANMLRMKSKAMDSKGNVVQQTTYNIQDSAVTGGIGFVANDDDS